MTTDNTFPWGQITKIHEIGDIRITEYVVGEDWEARGKTEFDVNEHSYDTLDQALLGALCNKYDTDSRLFSYVVKLLPRIMGGNQ